MKIKGSWQRALIGLLVFSMTVPAPVFAQGSIPVFRQEELDQLLAPIALYPDSLLAQILMAATYPLEVVQADRWVRQNRNLPVEALNDSLDRQSWDPSVKALVPFPDVLSMMSEKLDWTQSVGDAFLAQETDVMETIQRLRAKAYAAGHLRSNHQQTVSREGTVIIIQPVSPQVIYVPVYNPLVVYGRWWYPAYPPVVIQPHPPGAVIAAGIITFGIGVAVASAWNHGWGHCDWRRRNVYVNVNRTVNINRPATVIHPREMRTMNWQHSPEHRRGVAYRDPRTREKFAPANRQGVDNRRDFRGYDQTRPSSPGSGTVGRPSPQTGRESAVSRPQPDRKPAAAAVERSAPQTRPAPTVSQPTSGARPGSGTVERPSPQTGRESAVSRPQPDRKPTAAAVERSAPQARPAPTVSRSAPSNTIYGVEQGNKARKESARGRDSLASPKGKGDGSSKPSPVVSQPVPANRPVPAQGGAKHDGTGPSHKQRNGRE